MIRQKMKEPYRQTDRLVTLFNEFLFRNSQAVSKPERQIGAPDTTCSPSMKSFTNLLYCLFPPLFCQPLPIRSFLSFVPNFIFICCFLFFPQCLPRYVFHSLFRTTLSFLRPFRCCFSLSILLYVLLTLFSHSPVPLNHNLPYLAHNSKQRRTMKCKLALSSSGPCLTLRSLTLYIYGAPILDVSRSHTTTQHSR